MKTDLLNLAGVLLALLAAIVGAAPDAPRTADAPAPVTLEGQLEPSTLPDGTRALRDAQATLVPLRDYRRIASATLLADRALLELCEPERIVAFTRYAAATPFGYRFAGKPTLGAHEDVERVLALRPELVIVSELVDPNYVARLREHGVQVFDLGPMHGLTTLVQGIRAIGLLIGAPARAEHYVQTLRERMAAIAPGQRGKGPTTLYLARYADKLFAAAADTSYHDVIEFAGLRDAAASHGLTGWPEVSGETVLAIDPEILLTREGMSESLCRHPGLSASRACRGTGRILELDGALLDDPGPTVLEAAEALHRAYVGLKPGGG